MIKGFLHIIIAFNVGFVMSQDVYFDLQTSDRVQTELRTNFVQSLKTSPFQLNNSLIVVDQLDSVEMLHSYLDFIGKDTSQYIDTHIEFPILYYTIKSFKDTSLFIRGFYNKHGHFVASYEICEAEGLYQGVSLSKEEIRTLKKKYKIKHLTNRCLKKNNFKDEKDLVLSTVQLGYLLDPIGSISKLSESQVIICSNSFSLISTESLKQIQKVKVVTLRRGSQIEPDLIVIP